MDVDGLRPVAGCAGKIELLGLDQSELEDYVAGIGESRFRARQISEWLKRGAAICEMTNISKKLRERLENECVANPVEIDRALVSKIDGTEKYLYRLMDGNLVEGVLMRYHYGNTLCASTQVGCRMGCRFCASTLNGRVRNLTPGEILGQAVAVNRRLSEREDNQRIHNIVLMGSGEPLDNYENTLKFLRLVNSENGLNISMRNISLSTCGLVDMIDRLADERLGITLSISLHAPNDTIRRQLMPVAKAYPMESLISACRRYVDATSRRIIFEYALVKGVNCSMEAADELAAKLRGLRCHVNLIPLNDVKETGLFAPGRGEVESFMNRLEKRGISVTLRRELGSDINGACGQLRRSVIEQSQHDKQD